MRTVLRPTHTPPEKATARALRRVESITRPKAPRSRLTGQKTAARKLLAARSQPLLYRVSEFTLQPHPLPTSALPSKSYQLNKKSLTETDIRTKFITPAIVGADGMKWNVMTQVREEVFFTKGRVIVRGKTVRRGEAKKADYLLDYKPKLPLAVVEAKDNNQSVGAGMPQALEYAEILDLPFAYSSNGDAFLEHDRTGASGVVEREIPLDQFPSPEELWQRYCAAKGIKPEQISVI